MTSGAHFLISFPAVDPDLPTGTRERTDVPHVHHGTGEVAEELGRVGVVGADLGVGGTSIEELLIRVQKPLLVHKISVVEVVKGGRRRDVEG